MQNPVSPSRSNSINGKCLALYSCSGLPLGLSPLTEDTSKITVSSCGVKLQEVLSGLFIFVFVCFWCNNYLLVIGVSALENHYFG